MKTPSSTRPQLTAHGRPATSASGFTLLEVALAIAVLAVMIVINYKTIKGLIEAKLLLDDKRDGMFIANSILTRIARELQLTVNTQDLLNCSALGASPAAAASAGMSGTGAAAGSPPGTPAGGGAPKFLADSSGGSTMGGGTTLTFIAKEAGQYLPDRGMHSGLVQITYRMAVDPDQRSQPQGQRSFVLVREELPYRLPAARACKGVLRFPITKNLLNLEFQFYDPSTKEWVTSWDGARSVRVPEIIQFKVVLLTPQGEAESYTTAVHLRAK